jgi:hypothetical protein
MSSEQQLLFRYTFNLAGGPSRCFEVRLEAQTLSLIKTNRVDLPEWTRLESCQCPNCPLDAGEHPHCPLAVDIIDLVEFFTDFTSYDEVEVNLQTKERDYVKRTSVQKGVSSLMGIYMVSSGCPIMDKLRPMVRFHLPFATIEETTYRAISMYLIAQYFRSRHNLAADWDLKHLTDVYEEVQTVNRSFVGRFKQIELHDASANALVILDNFANYVALALDEDMLDDMEYLFTAYMEE